MRTQHMSYQEFRKKKKPRNKYGNKKTVVDGISFMSKAEALYYQQLKWLKQAKQIKYFSLQPKFILQESFKKNGKTIRAIHYIADFAKSVRRIDSSCCCCCENGRAGNEGTEG